MRKLRGGHDTDDDDGGSPTTSPSVVTYDATCPDPVHGVRLKHSRLLLKKHHYDNSPLWESLQTLLQLPNLLVVLGIIIICGAISSDAIALTGMAFGEMRLLLCSLPEVFWPDVPCAARGRQPLTPDSQCSVNGMIGSGTAYPVPATHYTRTVPVQTHTSNSTNRKLLL